MKKEEYFVKNFVELHQILTKYQKEKKWYFRGHSDPIWKLVPKIGRDKYKGVDEELVFNSWKRRAVEFVSKSPENDWEWLSIAQHHGLATRLLDWSINPLNAIYFSLKEHIESDAVLYAIKFNYKFERKTKNTSPFKIDYTGIYYPKGIVSRIVRQNGVFSVHHNPQLSLDEDVDSVQELNKIIIDHNYRKSLIKELSFYGINAANLFPDLDGLSEYVNWAIVEKEYYWDSKTIVL
jgi:hypothetical protein